MATPLLAPGGPGDTLVVHLYSFFSKVCHQFPSRSFTVAGHVLPVCARCTGIYSGFLIGALACAATGRDVRIPFHRIWAAAALPMVVDVVLSLAGVWEGTLLSRALTGGFFGVAGGVVFMQVVKELPPPVLTHGNGKEQPDAAKT